MKKLLLLPLFIFVTLLAFNQEIIQMRAANPDFIQYLNKKNNGEISNHSSLGNYLGEIPSPLNKGFDNFIIVNTKGIPTSYDLRTVSGGIYLTPVKNQGLEGACWAFATYSATESYWKKQGLATYDLSEQNLATCHGFDWTPSEGGNSDLSVAYLSRRSGPISEADDPYTLPSNPTCETGHTPIAYVAQSRTLPGSGDAAFSIDVVKQAIMDYGALYANMFFDDDYMNYANYTYYYNGSGGTNHGVAIVGWDNAKVCSGGIAGTPAQPGAWIIKNSWGTGWGQSGYFYISFYDTEALSDVAYFPSHIDYNANSQIYYYDDFGAISALGYSDGDDYSLIKYVASGNQQLSKLGTFILDAGTTVSFDVYDNFNGTTLSGLLGSISNQACALPGYYTFDLATAINLTSGNDFYIKVRYNSGENFPIPVEVEYAGYASGVTYQTGKCWISDAGSGWTAIGSGTSNVYDLCVKAYTTTTATSAPTANFTADQTTVTIGTTVYFSDLSTGVPTSWSWAFEGGDPTSSTVTNPSITYNTPGTYDVTLTVSNGLGSDDITIPNFITVTSAPITCEYVDNIETDDNIVFYKVTGGYLSGPNANNFPEFAEHYTSHVNNLVTGVQLGVVQADVLSADAKITIKIWSTTAGKPGTVLYSEDFDIADFTAGGYNDISFASSTTVPDDFFIGYQIYTTTPQDTFAVYQAEDRGTASTVTSTAFVKYSGTWRDVDVLFGGLNTSFSIYPEICPTPPNANFTASPTSGCGTLNVQFTDASSANTDSWFWDFGDGQTSPLESPLHTYNTPGTYTVSLTATNTIGTDIKTMTDYIVVGTIPTAVTVSGGGTQCGGTMLISASGGTGGTIYWQNTTSNGTSTTTASSSQSVSTSGTYYFRARSPQGCWGTQGSAVATINSVPTNVSVSGGGTQCGGTRTLTATGGTGGTIYFQNTTSGGTSTATASSSQVIAASGTYYFRSQSAAGCWGNEGSAEVIIHPEVIISMSSTNESAPGANDGTATVDILSGIPNFDITWGPIGGSTTISTFSHTISGLNGSTYCVTVVDDNGCSDIACETVYTISPPIADFSADQTLLCDDFTVNFTDESMYLPTSWAWDFGDGNTSNEQNPTHIYSALGSYTVSLSVVNAFGSNEIEIENFIVISENPVIEYEALPASADEPFGGEISATVTGGSEPYIIEWGHNSEETSLNLTGLEYGDYYLTVTEAEGCQSSTTIFVDYLMYVSEDIYSFKIYPNPVSDFITISFSDECAKNIELVNITGEVVFSTNNINTTATINLENLSPGIYFISLKFAEKTFTHKIILQ
jgi:PKD repeat protein/C1A family cysteine protease